MALKRSSMVLALAALLVAFGSAGLATPVAAQGKVRVTPLPRVGSVQPGAAFEVDVVLESSVPIRTAQAGLSFDPALVEVVGVTEGDIMRQFAIAQGGETLMLPAQPRIDNAAGSVEVVSVSIMGMTVEGGVTGTGVLFTYQMRAKPGADGTSPLSLSNVVIGDANADAVPEADIMVGTGEAVVSATGAASVTGGPSVSEPALPTQPRVAPQPGAVVPAGVPAGEEDDSLPTGLLLALGGGLLVMILVGAVLLRNR